ncbi:VOC family protein [Nocardioides convexus]|uniref:VOC family protein n=1 Tax=Nocardioides convexus TaxID=2712224 RepID=UPI003100B773
MLGFEVLNDVGYGEMRWITVAPAGQQGPSIVLAPPAADPGITEEEKTTIAEMMAKGTYATVVLTTSDLDRAFERIQATGAEVIQEPIDQPYGVRDCAFRDPAGNHVRINQG